MSRIPLGPLSANNLGDYLREQRQSARLSLRQLSELAGVSNPYLSQIERGLKKPSAEILQQLAKGLEVSAESLYVRAGILDERHGDASATHGAPLDTRAVIGADPQLTDRQKAALLDIYDSFVGIEAKPTSKRPSSSSKTTSRTSTTRSRTTNPRNEGE
jgi:transcriptional regulator with XRE-family HTH domain